MYLWLAVTPDEYELIIAVETSAAKLAHRLGTSPCSINNAYKRGDAEIRVKKCHLMVNNYIK